MSQKTIEQVQEAHTPEWMAIPGVEGTAIGLFKGKPCIKIFASVKPENLRSKIPSNIEGYPVVIEETGTFRPLEPQESDLLGALASSSVTVIPQGGSKL